MAMLYDLKHPRPHRLVGALLNQLGTWTEELREDLGVINEAVYVRLNEIIEYVSVEHGQCFGHGLLTEASIVLQ